MMAESLDYDQIFVRNATLAEKSKRQTLLWLSLGGPLRSGCKDITSSVRLSFRDDRDEMPGICFTHLDTEPCAECWIP